MPKTIAPTAETCSDSRGSHRDRFDVVRESDSAMNNVAPKSARGIFRSCASIAL